MQGQIDQLRQQSIESHRWQGIAEQERDAAREEAENLRARFVDASDKRIAAEDSLRKIQESSRRIAHVLEVSGVK
jgi:uncharacterized coiled-coil DUF342 family protein